MLQIAKRIKSRRAHSFIMDTPSLPTPQLNLPQFVEPPVTSNDKLLAILCHLSFIIGVGFILPLIIYLVKRNESVFVATHAREVLNFHLSILLYIICCIPLFFVLIGFVFFFVIALVGFVCAIIGAIKVSEARVLSLPADDPGLFRDQHDNGLLPTFWRVRKKSINASRTWIE